jgi:hypothetical protein
MNERALALIDELLAELDRMRLMPGGALQVIEKRGEVLGAARLAQRLDLLDLDTMRDTRELSRPDD